MVVLSMLEEHYGFAHMGSQADSIQPDLSKTASTRVREFKYAENQDTYTIACLKIDEIELLGTRYYGKLYIGKDAQIVVAGPVNVLRASQINRLCSPGQDAVKRFDVDRKYFSRRELIDHAIELIRKGGMIHYIVLGNSFDDPNDCEVVWRRYPKSRPTFTGVDTIPF